MKKKLNQLFVLLILCSLCFSCDRETPEKQASFPQELYADKISAKTDIRIFTNKTEIKDTALKNEFINSVRNHFGFQTDTVSAYFNLHTQPLDENDKVTFLTKDTATFFSSSVKFFVIKSNSQYLFYSGSPVVPTDDNILYDLLKFTYPKTPVPSVNGNGYITKEVRVGNGNYTEIQLSMISYKITRGAPSGGNFSGQAGILFNEFNENVILKLGPYDTLAVQEFSLLMKAK